MPRCVLIAALLTLLACAGVAAASQPNPLVGLWTDGSRQIAIVQADDGPQLVVPPLTPMGNCWGAVEGPIHSLAVFNGRRPTVGQTLQGHIDHWWPDFCSVFDEGTLTWTSQDELNGCNQRPPVTCVTLTRIPRLAPPPHEIPSPFAAGRLQPIRNALLLKAERIDQTGDSDATKRRKLRQLAAKLAASAARIPSRNLDDARYRACVLASLRSTAKGVAANYRTAQGRAEASIDRCQYVGIGLFTSGGRSNESPTDPTITSEATTGGRMTQCYTGDTLGIYPSGPRGRVTVTTPGHYADIVDKPAHSWAFPYAPNGRYEVDLRVPSLGIQRHAVLDRECPS